MRNISRMPYNSPLIRATKYLLEFLLATLILIGGVTGFLMICIASVYAAGTAIKFYFMF